MFFDCPSLHETLKFNRTLQLRILIKRMSDMQAEQIDKATRILVIGKHDYILEKVESICRSMTFDIKNAVELEKLETT